MVVGGWMAWSLIGCIAAAALVSIVVVFLAIGALTDLQPPLSRIVGGGLGGLLGVVIGNAMHRRFFAAR